MANFANDNNAAPGVAETVLNNIYSNQPKKRGWFARKPKRSQPGQGQNKAINQGQTAPIVKPVVVVSPVQKGGFKAAVASFAHSLYTWEWTKGLVYWLILSAGTASDLIFLMASFWMSVNANVHDFILQFMDEKTATNVTYLATTAYVALPIFIVGLATVQTVNHIKMWNIGGFWSKLWAIIFGIPAVTFLLMDFVTISCSVVNVTFQMPGFFVVLRADSAFIFAFGSLIFFFLGKPQERERLAEKDGMMAGLQAEMKVNLASLAKEKDDLLAALRDEKEKIIVAFIDEKQTILANATQEKESLLAKIDVQNDEIESLKTILAQTQKGFTELHKALSKSDDDALQAYGDECIAWLKGGVKSADVETISRYTGLSIRKIGNALDRGDLKVTTKNEKLILISSLVPWLKSMTDSNRNTDVEIPALRMIKAQ